MYFIYKPCGIGARRLKRILLLTRPLCVPRCFCPVWLCATLWTVAHQAPLHGTLQSRMLEWVAISLSRASADPGTTSASSCLQRWQMGSIPLGPGGKPRPLILKQADLNAAPQTSTTPYLLHFQNISRSQPSSYPPLPPQFSVISLLAYWSSLQSYLLSSTFTNTPLSLAKVYYQFGSRDDSLKLVRSCHSSAQIFPMASLFTQNKK